MTLEDAKYYGVLLGTGEFEEFKTFINDIISSTSEIDEIESELLFADGDYNKCAEILSNYIGSKNVDDTEVVYRLINYLKNKSYNREQTLFMFEKFVREANKTHEDRLEEPWVTMKLFSLIGTKDSIVYDSDYDEFINTGKILTENKEIQEKLSKLFG